MLPLAFSVVLVAIASCNAQQCSFSCPTTDTSFYPLGSGPSIEGVLACYYPFIANCLYGVDGSLIADSDAGFCPSMDCCTCPSVDLNGDPLGPNSGPQGSDLFCTYLGSPDVTNEVYYCEYSLTDGSLLQDEDAGLCPLDAVTGECTTAPPTIPPPSTVPPPTIPTPPTTTTVASPIVSLPPTVFSSPVLSTSPITTSTPEVSLAPPSTTTKASNSAKHVAPIGVGGIVGALAFLAF